MIRRVAPLAAADPTVAALAALAGGDRADGALLRRTLAVAVLVHLALLAVRLPATAPAPRAEERRPVFVMQTVRFAEPPRRVEPRVPPRRPFVVPMPDPHPDDPEPIRELAVEEPLAALPVDASALFDLPAAPPPPPAGPIHVVGDVRPPVRVDSPPPVYPEPARRARIQGVVVVQAVIDEGGRVGDVEVLRGLPLGLDEATVEAVRGWTFEPATLRGRPVAVFYTLTVRYGVQ